MKLLMITEVLVSPINLDGIEVNKVDQFIQTMISPTDYLKYNNVRFRVADQGTPYNEYDWEIVGDRPETPAEAKTRIDKSKKIRAYKKKSKQDKINELERELKKLKGVK